MPAAAKFMVAAALFAVALPPLAHADPKTVCTITVNSPDEREMFRRSLPPDEYRFVELVERGRPDWLASACRQGVRCDVLLISGHFDGGDEFYSDRVDARESLPVDEMERVSCSDSCPGLFSQLKEVYLFGCNTLNADALRDASGEIVRSFVRAGHSQADAEELARILDERHAASNRDRMRQIFKDVPTIYGFSSKAPLGPVAASVLDRYFASGAAGEIGSGRPSAKLLSLFSPVSMTVASGSTDSDPQAGYRNDVCHFADDRLSVEQRLAFVHELLRRDMAEVRLFLDRLERYAVTIPDKSRQSEGVAKALDAIAQDHSARGRYLEFARDADEPSVRARMIALAGRLGWLTAAERHAELIRMIDDRLARHDVGVADVDLICTLNHDGALGDALLKPGAATAAGRSAGHAGVVACLGSVDARTRVLHALTSQSDDDVEIAQVYLHHRPLVDVKELRLIANGIARMRNPETQMRALDTLAQHQLSDRESIAEVTRLFPVARSVGVQRAIAGILIRADYRAIDRPQLVRALRQHRLKSDGKDVIDVLIRRLEDDASPSA